MSIVISNIPAAELDGLQEFAIFVCKIYVKNWFTCNIAPFAPKNDLILIDSLKKYRKINPRIADACLEVFMRHLWYPSDILVGLAFFDDRIDDNTKIKMVHALKKPKNTDSDLFRNETFKISSSSTDIVSFISEKTLRFFRIVSGTEFVGFLQSHPSEWKNDPVFSKMQSIVNNLQVVNDAAERAIGLIKRLNFSITEDNAKHNRLLQVVENFRKTHPNHKKSTFQ